MTDSKHRVPSVRTLRAVAEHFENRLYDLRRSVAETGDHDVSHHEAMRGLAVAADQARQEAIRLQRGHEPVAQKVQITMPPINTGGGPWQPFFGGNGINWGPQE